MNRSMYSVGRIIYPINVGWFHLIIITLLGLEINEMNFMLDEWKALWKNKTYLTTWCFILFFVLIVLILVCRFLAFNELRTDVYIIDDYILTLLEPMNVSRLLFAITWICIFTGLPLIMRTPKKAMLFFLTVIIIGFCRCLVMYFVPLDPPEGIIPLRDEVLEGSFYNNKVLLKDLFFSGHTSNLALLTLLMDIKWLKYILACCTVVVGFLLLKQHVHYTIDVLAAPFFAYLSYYLAKKSANGIFAKLGV